MDSPLQRAIDIAGSQVALAKMIGVTQQTVSLWLRRANGRVPAEHAIAIEHATGVDRRELNTHVQWDRPNEADAA